ncbi:hypothetical protein FF38_00288 [Lucilia cuprina]|uniref:Uncharacterized protein n=1 Tax=Lucilia cuprina TaxID=7375 RepID=A0A0L0BNW1_LUCCU|nr:hypothetical protein FF38_00288 [Lucilia cuprina]
MHSKYLLLVLCIFPNSLYAAHILSIFGVPMRSQYDFIEPLLKELAGRDHQITSITNYPQKEPISNFRDVVVEKNKHLFFGYHNFSLDNEEANYYELIDEIYSQAIQMCINIHNDTAVRQILDNEKIDLIILDVFFAESFFGLAEYLKAPIVGVSTIGTMIAIDELVGNISPKSYIPHMILPLRQMNFWQRFLNVLLEFIEWAHYYRKYMILQEEIYKLYYPNAQLTFEEAQKNVSLVLLNDHFSLTTPRPYVPNMIEVAGLNIVANPDPLKPNIKNILDNAKEGVILITLDTFMSSYTLDVFFQHFKTLPYTVLWKTSQKISYTLPNVYIDADFVVASILPHPNIKLYITHGNFLSIIESVYHGLPILGISSFEKQDNMVDYIQKVGNGLSLKLHTISEKVLAKAFKELLETSHYANVAKTLSYRFRDQQNTPMERAIYWIEYVLRHKGATHLRNMGHNLTWWQFYNVDVMLAIFCFFAFITCLALVIQMPFKYLLIVLCIFPNSLYAAHILSLFGMPVPSQYAFIEPLLKELARRGHQITSITSFPQKQPVPNFRDVVVKKNLNLFIDYKNFTVDNIESNYYEIMDDLYNRAFQMCINIQNDATVRHILDKEKIDLIIMEVFFSESFFGLSEYLQAPIVGVSTLGAMISIDELVGNISPKSYLPNLILPLHEMTFWERLLNVILYFVELAHYYRKYMPIQKQIYNFYYPNAKLTFEEAQKNFSLVLLNDHFVLTTPRPYVPNMIEVAGLNIVTNPEPLTPVIKQILDSSHEGVILISLDVKLNPQTINIFLQQFKSMPQIVFWKTSQKISNPPSNVYISPNFVEASILPHPNIQLYINPGGFLSIIESVYHGLPILGVISTEKQEDYVDYVKRVGNGVSIKLHTITEKSLAKAFNELLETPYYANIAKTLSLRFRDQQNTPLERAVYWIEYVLRHKGAAHLRNMGQNLTWWQFYNVDVIIAILCIFALISFLALVLVKILIQFLWKLKTKRNISNMNKEKKV